MVATRIGQYREYASATSTALRWLSCASLEPLALCQGHVGLTHPALPREAGTPAPAGLAKTGNARTGALGCVARSNAVPLSLRTTGSVSDASKRRPSSERTCQLAASKLGHSIARFHVPGRGMGAA